MIFVYSEEVEAFLASNDKEHIIDNCKPFQRLLVYQMLEKKFSSTIFARPRVMSNFRKVSNGSHMFIHNGNVERVTMKVIVIERAKSLEEMKLLNEDRLKKEEEELDDAIGLTKVIKMLSESVMHGNVF